MKLRAGKRAAGFLTLSVLCVGCGAGTGAAGPIDSEQPETGLPKPTFNDDGTLNRPERYREWTYIGTPLTPNSLNPPEAPFPEFHNVYIHPDDFAEWSRSGTFPDGTILVKELVLVGSEQAVSGNGFFMGDFAGLEATVKDSSRFSDEPGNWAYFSWGHAYPLADIATAFPTASCNSCHAASAADDFVFTQYYPIMRAARVGASTSAPAGRAMGPGNATFDALEDAMTGALADAMTPNSPAGSSSADVPTDDAALFEFLTSGSYRAFANSESAPHPSRGPHTRVGLPVQVYYNDVISESLGGGGEHAAGSSIVKEMFDESGELAGWAVMVKTEEVSDGGNGWFWYELASTENVAPVASGNGVPLCFGCHSGGSDFVLSDFPPR